MRSDSYLSRLTALYIAQVVVVVVVVVMGISTTLEEAADAARVSRTGAVRPGARRGGGARMIYP